jgi:hypothetical protein
MKIMRFFSRPEFLELGAPQPMKNFIPEWYRKAEATWVDDMGGSNPGLKKCIPYLDSLVSGYAITTPVDIFVTEGENGELNLRWDGPGSLGKFIQERPHVLGATMPRPEGHHDNHLVFSGFWGMKTPRKYSLLVTHPFNRFDLPFTTTTGFMDSDEFFSSGNIPFFMKKGFVGTIPAGTPIAQLLPVRRDNWKMIKQDKGLLGGDDIQGELVRNPETLYKRVMWHKKDYS